MCNEVRQAFGMQRYLADGEHLSDLDEFAHPHDPPVGGWFSQKIDVQAGRNGQGYDADFP
jgi:hypothetical protein